MSIKWRLIAWIFYTSFAFLCLWFILPWQIALVFGVILGFFAGLLNEVIQWLGVLARHFVPKENLLK